MGKYKMNSESQREKVGIKTGVQDRGDVSDFIDAINSNYRKTSNYYRQRISAMIRANAMRANKNNNIDNEQIEKVREVIEKGVMEELITRFEIASRLILSDTRLVPTPPKGGQKMFKKLTNNDIAYIGQVFGMSAASIKKAVKNQKATTQTANANAVIGFIKEQFVGERIQEFAAKAGIWVDNLTEDIVNEIFKETASMGQAVLDRDTPFRLKGQPLGIDYGSKNQLNRSNNKQGVAIKGLETLTERGEFIVNLSRPDSSKYEQTRANQWEQIENTFLNPTGLRNRNWGMQIKKFPLGQKVHFAYRSSALMKNLINKYYKEGQDFEFHDDYDRTWNANYALYFMMTKVSDNLVSLLGPTTIGVMFGDDFMWMDEFVDTYLLRYEQIIGLRRNTKRQSLHQDEIFPFLPSNELHAYHRQRMGTLYYTQKRVGKRGSIRTAIGKSDMTNVIDKSYYNLTFDSIFEEI